MCSIDYCVKQILGHENFSLNGSDFINDFCLIPFGEMYFWEEIYKLMQKSQILTFLRANFLNWLIFLFITLHSGLGIGMLLSFIWIVIMRWLAGLIVWGSLLGLMSALGFGKFKCFLIIFFKEI